MAELYNEHIQQLIRLTREMMVLADMGDRDRIDPNCGVLYGSLRDAAYKLRSEAEQERTRHNQAGAWDIDEDNDQKDNKPTVATEEP